MPAPGERVAHWVRPNEAVRVPRRNIFLHAVAKSRRNKDGAVRSWGVAVATFRTAAKNRKPTERTEVFTEPSELWDAVTGHTIEGARTVLWAHNLGYDVRLGDCLRILPRLGWELLAHNLAPKGTWLIWGKGKLRLTMVDLSAVFPKLLPEIGKTFGLAFPESIPFHETPGHALERCKTGELIVRTAATAYLQWIEDAGLGNWQMTGAGQSYAAFRHRFLTHPMLVHDTPEALTMERAAMWTGRCEAYWHGSMLRETVQEWDFTASYASICAERALPVKLVGPMPDNYPWRRHLADERVALVAHVTVTTPQPVVPCRHEGRILWPVGRFETTLWDIEIAEVLRVGGTVEVHSGFLYRKAPALKAWAHWVLEMIGPESTTVPAWQKMIVKHWSTAAIGRFGMMFPEWKTLGTASLIGVDRRTCVDIDTGERYETMQVGRTIFRQGALVEWQNSMPAITGYVMAAARVKLGRVLEALPPRTALYIDTDAILVHDSANDLMAALARTEVGHGLRLKRAWDGFGIYGPRQIVTGTKVRVAGVPSSARRIDRNVFEGSVWESLAVSMASRRPNKVVARDRVWHAKGVDKRRIGPPFGWTEPYSIGVDR